MFKDPMTGTPGNGYVVHVWLGSPPQKLGVIVDTGSSNFAVAAAPNPAIRRFFQFQRSSTFVNLHRTFAVRYARGYWDGELVSDILRLGVGINGSARVQFAAIYRSGRFFVPYSNWQGILGMAYPSIAMPPYHPVEPVFNQLVRETGIRDIFTLTLCGPIVQSQNYHLHDVDLGGMMTFGGIDHSLFTGPIFYTPIIRKWYYQVALTGIAIGGRSLGFSCDEYNQYKTIVDSGTTNFRVPESIFNRIIAFARSMTSVQVPNGFWEGREALCWEANNAQWNGFPYLEIALDLSDVNKTNKQEHGQFTLMIPPQQYLRLAEHVTVHNSPCYGFGVERSQGSGIILGDVIMEGFTVMFDRENTRVGFAASKCASKLFL
ncbi:uncharacterized protein TRIADDRAFT_23825 [Trichoplax adhaerens]|uniref:Peptidase A1 domain-containing protein n=1 Tax=Trichoplax adhaerens TaxID=10228 RepID=B3RU96_TRIAD|nr:hypothetical protein TRIADDRAFT_23825 [Trichoplax adhaerens]EDV25773.1 hypothetical protein TRIADDRAFT_23825 [Trichoplax adhaerens]|eukprot:XP_002111806.1 hypothetical protein TRIADDRAFT_23825 [Trichoplax adhaerens]